MARPKDIDGRTTQILFGAQAAFVKYGFANTTIEQVALEAGLSKGTIYLYFKNKDELVHSIIERHFLSLDAQLGQLHLRCHSPIQLVDFVREMLLATEPALNAIRIYFQIMGPELGDDHSPMIEMARRFFDKMAKQFTTVLRKFENRLPSGVTATAMARSIAMTMDGLILHRAFFGFSPKEFRSFVKAYTIGLGLQLGLQSVEKPK